MENGMGASQDYIPTLNKLWVTKHPKTKKRYIVSITKSCNFLISKKLFIQTRKKKQIAREEEEYMMGTLVEISGQK